METPIEASAAESKTSNDPRSHATKKEDMT